MGNKTCFTLIDFARDLRSSSYRAEWRGNWADALLYRVPSIGLAWMSWRLGLAPIAVTALALLVALALPAAAYWTPLGTAPLAVFGLGVLFQILDCTDGTLARTTGSTSQTGADLDFLIDMAQWGFLYIAIGILADRILGGGWAWTALAGFAAWGRILARLVRDQLNSGLDRHGGDNTPSAPLRPLQIPVVVLGGISGLIPFLALSGSWLGVAVAALTVYSLLDIAEGLLPLATRE